MGRPSTRTSPVITPMFFLCARTSRHVVFPVTCEIRHSKRCNAKRTCTRGTHQGRQRAGFNITTDVVKKPFRPTTHRNMVVEILPRKRLPVSLGGDPITWGSVHKTVILPTETYFSSSRDCFWGFSSTSFSRRRAFFSRWTSLSAFVSLSSFA